MPRAMTFAADFQLQLDATSAVFYHAGQTYDVPDNLVELVCDIATPASIGDQVAVQVPDHGDD